MKKWLTSFALAITLSSTAQEYLSYPMWNHLLPIEQRVDDVVKRLTLEEKVLQMLNATPAIPRLGIPAYDWWNEVLHGVARTPFYTTSYPQAIGMAATWDTTSLKQMADYSATEGRAVHNKATALGRNNERYMGLTYWTPNINIFRDPRWGRGQETYGEDPFLTAKLGAAFVRGLQGDDPNYLKAAACAKHFAVHSGPEPSRHSDNFNPSVYDLWDTYLPAFKELVVNASVAGVMCAYNAVNTQPCCGNDQLMTDILRKQWNFTGYVTSDCWGVDDFYRYHKTHPDAQSSAIDAVMHGTDIECGQSVYLTLLDAVKEGKITEPQLDVSLKRLFTIRFRLGMFDPVEKVKYAQTPVTALEAPEHQALALKMARQSIVLLKNEPHKPGEKNLLPLSKKVKKLAVMGPNADNKVAILGNYNGIPSKITTVLQGIKDKLGSGVEVVYHPAIQFTHDTLFIPSPISESYFYQDKKGVYAEYFNNEKLEGTPIKTAIEKEINHYWQEGATPYEGMQSTNYSARYTTYFTATQNELLHFEADANDACKVFVNDSLWVDAWEKTRFGAKTFQLTVENGKTYKLVMEYRQGTGDAMVKLVAGHYERTDLKKLAQSLSDADAIIYVGGISPQLEGEEMKVNYPGFNGGDRTSILLPAIQTELLKQLHQTGKPVVFVMMTGSAIAIPWENENLPAILNAWYGGQSAGTAVADVLFGDYNPAGRLPVTFYKSDNDIPDFSNYEMKGRTYRYFEGDALYPFGYGLSYSQFAYTNLQLPKSIEKGKKVELKVTVTNTGKIDGEEVVQIYLSHPYWKGMKPIQALKGFERIFLKAGESKTMRLYLTPEDLSLVNEINGELKQPKGTLRISVGGGQPSVKNKTTSNVLVKDMMVL